MFKISVPFSFMLPLKILPEVGINLMIDKPRVVFPQPDSPTTPKDSPFFKLNDKSSTALTIPFPVK
jgi:hypothetical protein